jgi:hypothetical protein
MGGEKEGWWVLVGEEGIDGIGEERKPGRDAVGGVRERKAMGREGRSGNERGRGMILTPKWNSWISHSMK